MANSFKGSRFRCLDKRTLIQSHVFSRAMIAEHKWLQFAILQLKQASFSDINSVKNIHIDRQECFFTKNDVLKEKNIYNPR